MWTTLVCCCLLALLSCSSSSHLWRKIPLEELVEVDESICPLQYQDEETFQTMDKLCQMCHSMFRHEDWDLHAKCRENCFVNQQFVSCFNQYSEKNSLSLFDRSNKKPAE